MAQPRNSDIAGPSSLWFDAEGIDFMHPIFRVRYAQYVRGDSKTGYDYSRFILTEKIIEKEFALSGSEQNPDLTNKSIGDVLKRILPVHLLLSKLLKSWRGFCDCT